MELGGILSRDHGGLRPPDYENGHPEPAMQTLGKGVLKLEAQVNLLLWSSDYLKISVFSFLQKKKDKKTEMQAPKL